MSYRLLCAASLAALLAAGTAHAQDFAPKTAGSWILNVRATTVDPKAGDPITTTAGAPTGLNAVVDSDTTPTLGLSYFFTDHIAVEVIAGTSRHDIRAVGGATNLVVKSARVLPPVVSLQYHFMPDQKISPYVGAGVNYMMFYSEHDVAPYSLSLEDGFGYALQAGVDVVVKDRWSVNVDVKKVFFDTDAVDTTNGIRSDVSLDPWVISTGIGYRF